MGQRKTKRTESVRERKEGVKKGRVLPTDTHKNSQTETKESSEEKTFITYVCVYENKRTERERNGERERGGVSLYQPKIGKRKKEEETKENRERTERMCVVCSAVNRERE